MLDIKYLPRHLKYDTLGNLKGGLFEFLRVTKDYNIFVAGGFVRDLLANKPFKDLDITINPNINMDILMTLIEISFGFKCTYEEYNQQEAQDAGAYEGNNIHKVYKCLGAPIPIDIIVRWDASDPLALISGYDLSINQACFLKGDHHTSIVYNTSKVVTFNPKAFPKPARIKRLKDKYPDYDWAQVDKHVQEKQGGLEAARAAIRRRMALHRLDNQRILHEPQPIIFDDAGDVFA